MSGKKTRRMNAEEAQNDFSFELVDPKVELTEEDFLVNAGLSKRAERITDVSKIKVGDVFIIKYRGTGFIYNIKVVVSGVLSLDEFDTKYYVFNRVVTKDEVPNYREDKISNIQQLTLSADDFTGTTYKLDNYPEFTTNPDYKLYYPGPIVALTASEFRGEKNVDEVIEYLTTAAEAVRNGTAGGLMLPDELIREILSYIATANKGYGKRSNNPRFRKGGKTRKTNRRKTKKM